VIWRWAWPRFGWSVLVMGICAGVGVGAGAMSGRLGSGMIRGGGGVETYPALLTLLCRRLCCGLCIYLLNCRGRGVVSDRGLDPCCAPVFVFGLRPVSLTGGGARSSCCETWISLGAWACLLLRLLDISFVASTNPRRPCRRLRISAFVTCSRCLPCQSPFSRERSVVCCRIMQL
jgi:hypothetical protein